LKGATELTGDNVAHTEVRIEHKAEGARSNQHFKMVLHDQSKGSFEGKIYVDSVAQKTEAYQLNNNLLLGDRATIFTKPNLEIFADDVKASHGATVTRLSEEELFYFQSRGIGKERAGSFLAKGFLKEVLYDGV
jgi:Fe-S cluster assembly protein SufD